MSTRNHLPSSPLAELAPAGLLLIDDVLRLLGGISKATLYRLIKHNGFPKGGHVRGRTVWRWEAVARWIMGRFPDPSDSLRGVFP